MAHAPEYRARRSGELAALFGFPGRWQDDRVAALAARARGAGLFRALRGRAGIREPSRTGGHLRSVDGAGGVVQRCSDEAPRRLGGRRAFLETATGIPVSPRSAPAGGDAKGRAI